MAPLNNRRRERFAWAIAEGKSRDAAMAEAKYAPGRSNAHRIIHRDDVQRRIAEIMPSFALLSPANPAELILSLTRLARDCHALGTPAACREARLTLLEAHRLRQESGLNEHEDGCGSAFPLELTVEEWMAEYGVKDAV